MRKNYCIISHNEALNHVNMAGAKRKMSSSVAYAGKLDTWIVFLSVNNFFVM